MSPVIAPSVRDLLVGVVETGEDAGPFACLWWWNDAEIDPCDHAAGYLEEHGCGWKAALVGDRARPGRVRGDGIREVSPSLD